MRTENHIKFIHSYVTKDDVATVALTGKYSDLILPESTADAVTTLTQNPEVTIYNTSLQEVGLAVYSEVTDLVYFTNKFYTSQPILYSADSLGAVTELYQFPKVSNYQLYPTSMAIKQGFLAIGCRRDTSTGAAFDLIRYLVTTGTTNSFTLDTYTDGKDNAFSDSILVDYGTNLFYRSHITASYSITTNLSVLYTSSNASSFSSTNLGNAGSPPVYKQVTQLCTFNGISLVRVDRFDYNATPAIWKGAYLYKSTNNLSTFQELTYYPGTWKKTPSLSTTSSGFWLTCIDGISSTDYVGHYTLWKSANGEQWTQVELPENVTYLKPILEYKDLFIVIYSIEDNPPVTYKYAVALDLSKTYTWTDIHFDDYTITEVSIYPSNIILFRATNSNGQIVLLKYEVEKLLSSYEGLAYVPPHTHPNATSTTSGFVSTENQIKLNNLESNLALATQDTLGRVKIKSTLDFSTDNNIEDVVPTTSAIIGYFDSINTKINNTYY